MGVVHLPVTLERFGILFHVNSRWQEVLVDEPNHPLIRPHLGIQPSTAASHRGGAEIEQNGLVLLLRFFEDGICVVAKCYFHRSLLAEIVKQTNCTPPARLNCNL